MIVTEYIDFVIIDKINNSFNIICKSNNSLPYDITHLILEFIPNIIKSNSLANLIKIYEKYPMKLEKINRLIVVGFYNNKIKVISYVYNTWDLLGIDKKHLSIMVLNNNYSVHNYDEKYRFILEMPT